MTAGSVLLARAVNAARRRARLARGGAVRAYPGVAAGRGVQIGRGVRLRIEPGGRVTLGDGCEVDDGVTLAAAAGGHLQLGEGTFVGHHATLAARDRVVIGEGTFLAELVSVRDHDHDPAAPPSSGRNRVSPVSIGRDCWVAAKATVTRGVVIGDGAVVGANAVVTRDVPAGTVVVGIPARARHDATGPRPGVQASSEV